MEANVLLTCETASGRRLWKPEHAKEQTRLREGGHERVVNDPRPGEQLQVNCRPVLVEIEGGLWNQAIFAARCLAAQQTRLSGVMTAPEVVRGADSAHRRR